MRGYNHRSEYRLMTKDEVRDYGLGKSFNELKEIPVDKIAPLPLNCNYVDDETFAKLVEDIKANDLCYAILVRPVGPDRYQIVDGHHRFRAVLELGGTVIKAEVVEMDENEAQITNVRLNMERGHLDLVKLAEVFSVEKKKGHSEAEIGKGYGFSQQRISQILEINGYSEGMKHVLTTRVVSERHTRAIVGGIKDQKLQLQVADEVIKRRLSTRETEELIRELKGVKKAKRASRKSPEVAELSTAMPSATAVPAAPAENAPNAPNTTCGGTVATAVQRTPGATDEGTPKSPANLTQIEFSLRGISERETFSPITLLYVGYLKYLGGPEMEKMSFGEVIDYVVRKFCEEKDLYIRVTRSSITDNVRI
jgi:ParB family chromosome partitioning protein